MVLTYFRELLRHSLQRMRKTRKFEPGGMIFKHGTYRLQAQSVTVPTICFYFQNVGFYYFQVKRISWRELLSVHHKVIVFYLNSAIKTFLPLWSLSFQRTRAQTVNPILQTRSWHLLYRPNDGTLCFIPSLYLIS